MAKLKNSTFDPATIDEMLDHVDLTFSNYTPSEEALEFFAIVRALHGEDFDIPNQKLHYFMIDMMYGKVTQDMFPYGTLNNRITVNPKAIAIVLSRGLAKSSIVTLFFPLVCAVKGETPVVGKFSNMLILSDTQDGGAKSQYELLKETVEQNKERFKLFFESWTTKDYTVSFVRKGNTDLKYRHMRIVLKGAMSGGIRSGSRNPVTKERYAILIGDDVIAREDDAKSEVIMSKVRSALFSDAKRAMRGGSKKQMILVNTLYTKTDPIYTTTESGAYTPLAIPICKEIYEGLEEKDFVGAWPEMHPYEAVYTDYLDSIIGNQKREFMQELMCRISDEDARIVKDNEIKWYNKSSVIKNRDDMNYYVTTDFTSSEEADRKNDFSGMALWGVDHKMNHYLIDLRLTHYGIEEQYDKLFEMIDQWCGMRGAEIAVEVDGNQRPHMVALKNKMKLENKMYLFARQRGHTGFVKLGGQLEGIQSKKAGRDKLDRFKLVSPLFKNGKIWFPEDIRHTPDMEELLREIRYTTWQGIKGHDDGVDLISMLNAIEIDYPTESIDTVKEVKKNTTLSAGAALMGMIKAGVIGSNGLNINSSDADKEDTDSYV